MTNGDRIRQMSDEELFDKYFWYYVSCGHCKFTIDCKSSRRAECREMWLKWLGAEEEEEEK